MNNAAGAHDPGCQRCALVEHHAFEKGAGKHVLDRRVAVAVQLFP